MSDLLSANQFFDITLTLLAFSAGSLLHKKFRSAVINPILIGAVIVMVVLTFLDIPNETYQSGCKLLSFFLTPATICLSISLYSQFQAIKKHIPAVLVGLTLGTITCLASVYLMCRAFGFDSVMTATLLPKSITTAIGVSVSEELGGIAAVTSASIVLTGILTNIAGPMLINIFKITNPIAQGVSLGTAGHVVGTAKAAEMGQIVEAVSSFSLTVTGILTTVILSFAAQYI